MTEQIRKNVFETNSSSSHSLTVSEGDITGQPFSDHTLREGVVIVGKGEYGWEFEQYYGIYDKLAYLITQINYEDIPQGDAATVTAELRESDPRFDMLCRVVEEHTGVKLQVQPGSTGYVDHQSSDVGLELFDDEKQLRQFLFNSNSYIETDNDNH